MGALFITLFPDKTFAIIFYENFNLVLFDPHVHFTVPQDQQTFEEALSRKDCRGLIVFAKKADCSKLISYIFDTIIQELRASSDHGSIAVFLTKN